MKKSPPIPRQKQNRVIDESSCNFSIKKETREEIEALKALGGGVEAAYTNTNELDKRKTGTSDCECWVKVHKSRCGVVVFTARRAAWG